MGGRIELPRRRTDLLLYRFTFTGVNGLGGGLWLCIFISLGFNCKWDGEMMAGNFCVHI